ncbi:hypothetical protein [Massilia sp. TN1-12]|uniref:hypothetical protein n=1 Tax=Massilia paldalensis TaxID=3377675 RepID=UPI00384ACD75
MDRLDAELTRLYQPLHGDAVRGIAIPFRKAAGGEARHWDDLCAIANALQADYGFPAPAVSVAARGGYVLWLSLEEAVPVEEARTFVRLLGRAHPDMLLAADDVGMPVDLPPHLDAATGTWSAFIHPGMGASFADESGLDMPPPAAGQLGFVDGLERIAPARFQAALAALRATHGAAPVTAPVTALAAPPAPPTAPAATQPGAIPDGLLLKDATLEDIVRFLHAKHIEPTFRHLIPPPRGGFGE